MSKQELALHSPVLGAKEGEVEQKRLEVLRVRQDGVWPESTSTCVPSRAFLHLVDNDIDQTIILPKGPVNVNVRTHQEEARWTPPVLTHEDGDAPRACSFRHATAGQMSEGAVAFVVERLCVVSVSQSSTDEEEHVLRVRLERCVHEQVLSDTLLVVSEGNRDRPTVGP